MSLRTILSVEKNKESWKGWFYLDFSSFDLHSILLIDHNKLLTLIFDSIFTLQYFFTLALLLWESTLSRMMVLKRHCPIITTAIVVWGVKNLCWLMVGWAQSSQYSTLSSEPTATEHWPHRAYFLERAFVLKTVTAMVPIVRLTQSLYQVISVG